MSEKLSLDLDALDFEKGGGLVTIICQDAVTGTVLMVAHADREALENTLRSGEMHYRSRTRGAWHKGATSGNVQRVVSLCADCDSDAVLARVQPAGPSCHSGSWSCFGDRMDGGDALSRLSSTIAERQTRPAPGSYTARLLRDRNLRLKKLGEECAELVVALADDDRERIIDEAADLLYHLLVATGAAGVTLDDVQQKLAERADAPARNSSALSHE